MAQSTGIPGLGPGDRLGPYVLETVLGEGAIGVVYPRGGRRRVRGRSEDPQEGALEGRGLPQALRPRGAGSPASSGTAISSRSSTSARRAATTSSRWTYIDGGSLREQARRGGVARDRRGDRARGPGWDQQSTRCTPRGSFTATSSRPTSCSTPSDNAAVTDFGLAKGPAYTVLTIPGQVMGTLDYIAPELIRGEESGPPGDVYALGCMVYECLSGSPPFGDRHVLAVVNAHLEGTPRRSLGTATGRASGARRGGRRRDGEAAGRASAHRHRVRAPASRGVSLSG